MHAKTSFLRGISRVCSTALLSLLASSALADSITVNAAGTIASACSLSIGSNFAAANLAISGNVSASATVNCNTGFVIKATSAKGAINTSNANSHSFVNTLPYQLTLTLPLDTGGSLVGGPCGSATLVSGQTGCALSPGGSGLSSGGATAVNQTATLKVAWNSATTKLVAGSYSNIITLSIATAQ